MDTVRSLIAVVVFFVALVCLAPEAKAHATSCSNSTTPTCDEGIAREGAASVSNALHHCTTMHGPNTGGGGWIAEARNVQKVLVSGTIYSWRANIYCKSADGNGNFFDGTIDNYFFQKTCDQRNAETDWINQQGGPRLANEGCSGGCRWIMDQPYETRLNHTISDGTSHTIYYGTIEWTADVCPASTPDPDWKEKTKPKEQECTPAGSGQSYCVKDNGQNCYTASSGRMICWASGQTGETTDGPIIQISAQGSNPPTAPLTPPPPNNSWTPSGTTNVTTITNNNVSNTTNISNFTTSGGAPAGSTNSGENNTGQSGNGQSSGSPGGTGEDGDPETGTPSTDCNVSPQCSSGDSIGCAMLRQSWMQHCNFKGDIEGSGDAEGHQAAGESFLDNLLGGISQDDVFEDGDGEIPGIGDVEHGGIGGGGSCPIEFSFSAMGRSYQLNGDGLCQVLDALAMLILMLAVYHPGLILVSGGRR